MSILGTDARVYVAAGLFAVSVFLVGVFVLVTRTAIELTTRTVLTLGSGFGLFIAVYFVAWGVYRGIERKERAE